MRGVILFKLMEHKRNNGNTLLNRLQDSSSKANRYHIYEESGMPLRCLKGLHCGNIVWMLSVSSGWCGFRHWQILLAATGWSTKNIPQLWVREQGSLIQPHPSTGAFWFKDLSHVTHIDIHSQNTITVFVHKEVLRMCQVHQSEQRGDEMLSITEHNNWPPGG